MQAMSITSVINDRKWIEICHYIGLPFLTKNFAQKMLLKQQKGMLIPCLYWVWGGNTGWQL